MLRPRRVVCSPKSRVRVLSLHSITDLPSEIAESAVVGSLIGMEGPGLYQKQKKRHAPNRLYWWNLPGDSLAAGEIVGDAVNLTRRLVNEPPQVVDPESFAATAMQVATGRQEWNVRFGTTALAGRTLRRSAGGCSRLRVALRGWLSFDMPVPHRVEDPWLTLVGKGVTFDSGGLSLKPSDAMKTMKCDMAGAATVLGAMQAIARLRLPVNVMGLVGLVENMPGAAAYKLGDVLTARNGKTIEVHNTDAEGRLVLADVLVCRRRSWSCQNRRPGDADRCLHGGAWDRRGRADDELPVVVR